jgi:hypothetical protein
MLYGYDGRPLSLEAVAKNHMPTLRETPSKVGKVLQTRRVMLAQVDADRRLSEEGKQEQRATVKERAIAELDQAEGFAGDAKGVMERAIAEALKVDRTPEEQLAYETRATRLWARFRPLLEGPHPALDPLELVQRESDNLDSLRVLKEELPDFMVAHGQPDQLRAAVLKVLEEAETALLPPEAQLARKLQAEIADGWPRLMMAVNYARAEVAGDTPWTVLPSWGSKHEVVEVPTLAL